MGTQAQSRTTINLAFYSSAIPLIGHPETVAFVPKRVK